MFYSKLNLNVRSGTNQVNPSLYTQKGFNNLIVNMHFKGYSYKMSQYFSHRFLCPESLLCMCQRSSSVAVITKTDGDSVHWK